MSFPTIDTVKLYFSWDLDIKPYVTLKVITAAQYKTITGTAYTA